MKVKPIGNYARPSAAQLRARDGKDPGWRIENHDTDSAELFIYDEIGWFGVMASDVLNALAEVTAPNINVRINSPGGDVFDGIAIFNALLQHPATVNTQVDSLAASAASFIAMAGDTVTMMPHSQMMIHDASGFVIGNAADMRGMADLLDRISNEIASMYAERAGGSTASWRDAMRAESWYTPQEAVDAGLADAVGADPRAAKQQASEGDAAGDGEGVAARWDLSVFTHAGRENAPAPYVPTDFPAAGPKFNVAATLRQAVRAAGRPAVNHADVFRRAFEEASK